MKVYYIDTYNKDICEGEIVGYYLRHVENYSDSYFENHYVYQIATAEPEKYKGKETYSTDEIIVLQQHEVYRLRDEAQKKLDLILAQLAKDTLEAEVKKLQESIALVKKHADAKTLQLSMEEIDNLQRQLELLATQQEDR